MNWEEYKKEITAIDREELEQIEIVAQLIARRKQMGLTQSDLAKKAGLKQSAIARLEREAVIPRLDTLEKIARALGLKLALVDEEACTYV
ncbi:helix-turn-helix domain-containing protein [Aeribacillus sp. FSL K6-1121]|uniref:helix-turn-helix domain-containing protein n=1 Tax=Aeribacillus sp. FSL K6-1121 TaxID=2954745 RepID=UPI0030F9349D